MDASQGHKPTTGLARQIRKTRAFLEADNLAQLTLHYKPSDVALLVIDVQAEFCDPDHREGRGNAETVAVSQRIQSMVPHFRAAGVPVYAVYYSKNGVEKPAADIDFFHFKPAANDTLVAKPENSAFFKTKFEEVLQRDGKKLLLACGFNQAACVSDTLRAATALGFNACLLEDLTGNDRDCGYYKTYATIDMERADVVMSSSHEALQHIYARRANTLLIR